MASHDKFWDQLKFSESFNTTCSQISEFFETNEIWILHFIENYMNSTKTFTECLFRFGFQHQFDMGKGQMNNCYQNVIDTAMM